MYVLFNDNKFHKHIQQRSQICRQPMYYLNNLGMCYPDLNTANKVHLYKSVCLPTLTYGHKYKSLMYKGTGINRRLNY